MICCTPDITGLRMSNGYTITPPKPIGSSFGIGFKKTYSMATTVPYFDTDPTVCGTSANIARKKAIVAKDPMREANLQVMKWVGEVLLMAPSYFRYYNDKPEAEIVVFLPRHVRVMLANGNAFLADMPETYTDENLTGPIEFCGWKVIDGYENALVVCTLRYAGTIPEYVFKVPIN